MQRITLPALTQPALARPALTLLFLAGALTLAAACDDRGASDEGAGGLPGDGDGDAGDGDGGDGGPPPEEPDGFFQAPGISGRFAYAPNRDTDRLAVIDSETMRVNVVDVAQQPTQIAGIPTAAGTGKVAVLCEGSDEVVVVSTSASGVSDLDLRPISPALNALAVSPDASWVVAFRDVDLGGTSTASDQEITVISLNDDAVWPMVVGPHPREIVFADDGDTAWVVTDGGVNVIDLAALAGGTPPGKPPLVPVVQDTGTDPDRVEVQIVPSARQAIARIAGSAVLDVTDLDTAELTRFPLPEDPTDLDVTTDGALALVTIGVTTGSLVTETSVLSLPLPADAGSAFTTTTLTGETPRVLALSDDGTIGIAFTQRDASGATLEAQRRVVVLRGTPGAWEETIPLFLDYPMTGVGLAPDGKSAVLLHDKLAGQAAWAYGLVDLAATFPLVKLQWTTGSLTGALLVPDGSRAAIMVSDPARSVRRVEWVDLRTFIVDGFDLGSTPIALGWIAESVKVLVSQSHASGRISFIDEAGAIETVTGFELNDAIKD
jgi:hypothetical protein